MPLTRIASFTPRVSKIAILIAIGKDVFSISHTDLAVHNTAAKIKAELEQQASLTAAQLPPIFVHTNRDDTVAIATGAAPKVWPEDENAEAITVWETSHESGDLSDWIRGQNGEAVFNSGKAYTTIEREAAHSGVYSLKHEVRGLDEGMVAARALRWAEHLQEGYYSAWHMFPILPQEVTGWLIVFRFKKVLGQINNPTWIIGIRNEGGDAFLTLSDWGNNNWTIPPNVNPVIPLIAGNWFHISTYYKSGLTDGIIRVWINDVLTWNFEGVDTEGVGGDIQLSLCLYGEYVSPGNLVMYVDDCRIGV